MRIPDWRNMAFSEGILSDPVREDNRVVLWLPAERDGEYQYWERIGTVPRGEIKVEHGICATPVTSILVRHRTARGFLSKLARKLKRDGGHESWVLPSGQPAERSGERRTDLVLIWPEDETASVGEDQVRLRWPEFSRFQKVGDKLFLVAGTGAAMAKVNGQAAPAGVQGTEELGCPVALAEQLLESARKSGDRSREAGALTDLGIVIMNEGDLKRAVGHLEKAVLLARELGEPARESDALNNLGYALLALGQAPVARQVLERALVLAREVKDAYAEKLIIERLGTAHANLRDPATAMAYLNRAMEMTRAAGDRQQETRLLWTQAITFADLNQRDEAIARAQESVDLLRKLGKPEASWYGAQLQRYRMDFAGMGGYGSGPSAQNVMSGPMGGSVMTAGQTATDQTTGPGLLRMAVSATKAMMKFIGTGLKAAPADIQRKRMATCQSCEHHTGLRCRICGCFTNVKTRMAHEQCPIGKWPE
jgi:tetratricopeptide (TPR) repeat protein